jgi:hypothetical protein
VCPSRSEARFRVIPRAHRRPAWPSILVSLRGRGQPVVRATREVLVEEAFLVSLLEMTRIDPSLLELADLPHGRIRPAVSPAGAVFAAG